MPAGLVLRSFESIYIHHASRLPTSEYERRLPGSGEPGAAKAGSAGAQPKGTTAVFFHVAVIARRLLISSFHGSPCKSPSLEFQAARLYRHSLRTLLSWAVDRDIFNEEATKLRARFDASRGVGAAAASRLLLEGEDELFAYMHPDPYCLPIQPGGSKFMRNSPPPMSVCFPDGNLPPDAPRYAINPDWSVASEETGRNATGTVLVDFYKKNME